MSGTDAKPQSDALVEVIRQALAEGASVEARASAADACRTLLAVFQADEGQPLAASTLPPSPRSPVAAVAQQLRGAPPNLVLDAVIGQLRALSPDGEASAPAAEPLHIPFVPIPTPKPKGQTP